MLSVCIPELAEIYFRPLNEYQSMHVNKVLVSKTCHNKWLFHDFCVSDQALGNYNYSSESELFKL